MATVIFSILFFCFISALVNYMISKVVVSLKFIILLVRVTDYDKFLFTLVGESTTLFSASFFLICLF